MDQQQYDKIWGEVVAETYNRSTGAFKRALWYGNNSAVFGQNKGVRKALRNAPKQIAMGGIGIGLDALAVPPGLSDLIEAAADTVLSKGKDVYSGHVKPLIRGNPPVSAEEGLRKNVKKDVKDLKANAFQVVDRNLVKLRDAKNKVSPAVRDMMQALSHTGNAQVPSKVPGHTEEAQLKKAHDALRAVAEAEYYVDKVTRLVASTQAALERIQRDLNGLKQGVVQTRNDMEGYIKEVL